MLRAQLGEDLYRQCIKAYLEKHQFGNVVTEDLSSIIEQLSGKSYDQFFDQWVYHAHYPELQASYFWDDQTRLAKLSIKQTQQVSDDVLLFNFPLKVVFKGISGRIVKTVTVKEKEEDFYFALPEAPETVLLDPDLELLARIDFKDLSTPMLYALLADPDCVAGQLFAIEQLKSKKDHQTLAALKKTLKEDRFYGVRMQAAKALQSIHSDESLEALLSSRAQSDARVRNQVIASIAGFYNTNAFDAELNIVQKEKNPDIQAQAIKALGLYRGPEIRELLLPLLQSESYRNQIADGAISAMREQDDPAYFEPIRQTLQKREADFTTRGFAEDLDALAYIARDSDKKDDALNFLLGYVNHKKKGIQTASLKALGTLENRKAIAILETFAAGKETPERTAAEQALAAIRAASKPVDNLQEIRSQMLDLQKRTREIQKDLENLRKGIQSRPGIRTGSPKSMP
jgi:aminopeptidase N